MDKYNIEGYPDPTAYNALSTIEKEERALRAFRPIVYICSPYAGDVEANVAAARKYSRFAVDMGAIPIAPHLLFPQFLSEKTERELALFMDMVLLGKCEQLWVFGSKVSDGMQREIAKAKKKNMKIRYFTDDFKEEAE